MHPPRKNTRFDRSRMPRTQMDERSFAPRGGRNLSPPQRLRAGLPTTAGKGR
jgi:hypothetical protein